MTRVVDDTRTFTIEMIAPEGFLKIISFDYTKSAAPGETINICWGTVQNQGGRDSVFLELVDKDTGEIVDSWSGVLDAGESYDFVFIGTMPDRDWNLELRAGHLE